MMQNMCHTPKQAKPVQTWCGSVLMTGMVQPSHDIVAGALAGGGTLRLGDLPLEVSSGAARGPALLTSQCQGELLQLLGALGCSVLLGCHDDDARRRE